MAASISVDKDEQRDIARKGGESVPDEKRSFSQDREAGKKGGEARSDSSGGNKR